MTCKFNSRGGSRNFERGGNTNQIYHPEILKRGAQVNKLLNYKSKFLNAFSKGGEGGRALPPGPSPESAPEKVFIPPMLHIFKCIRDNEDSINNVGAKVSIKVSVI